MTESFNPLGLYPEAKRPRYEKRAQSAHTSYKSACELKCIECCGFVLKSAIDCEIVTCPLWAMNQRIFKRAREKGWREPAEG